MAVGFEYSYVLSPGTPHSSASGVFTVFSSVVTIIKTLRFFNQNEVMDSDQYVYQFNNGALGCFISFFFFLFVPYVQKLVKVVAVDGSGLDSDEWRVYVLAEQSLQKWILVPGEVERLVYEFDVNRMVREAFHETVWVSCI
jgi:hypothetical protein